MKTIDSIQLEGKKVLIRVDFNVPLNENFEITDDTRIRKALPTLKAILDGGASIILMSHLGRPKNGPEDKFSQKHLVDHLSKELNTEVQFADDCVGNEAAEKAASLQPGQVLLLENTRFHKEETDGDKAFAEKLANLGDVYVNDAFGTAHRAHASTAIIADFFDADHKAFGYLMASEIENANKVIKEAKRPFTAIIGGAKVSDKISIIENLLSKADNIIIGGGMAYTFMKADGGSIGNSIVENDKLDMARKVMSEAQMKGVNLFLPEDSIIADEFKEDANTDTAPSNNIPDGWMGLDIGKTAREDYRKVIMDSKTILWNGPMGVFEMLPFSKGTAAIAKSVSEATDEGAFSLVGGGDSVAAVNRYELGDRISYVSTGGGAMLEYFEGKELPGIKAIMD